MLRLFACQHQRPVHSATAAGLPTCWYPALPPAPTPLLPWLQNKTTVHQLGLDLWRDVVVRNRRISQRLLDMLLDMVQVRRGGVLGRGGWGGGLAW